MHDAYVLDRLNRKYAYKRSNREFKLALLAAFKTCYWCGIECKDHPHEDGTNAKPDLATIDHTVSRFYRKKGEQVLKVLACYACNQRRSKEESEEFFRDKKNKRHLWR